LLSRLSFVLRREPFRESVTKRGDDSAILAALQATEADLRTGPGGPATGKEHS